MDIRAINTFQTIVRTGSFQAAARKLNFVQSTVTAQIQKLEAESGMKLIERGKKIRLTQAGQLFYEKADALIKNYNDLQLSMSELLTGVGGNIRIGVIEPVASYRLPNVVKSFQFVHPNVQISLNIQSNHLVNQSVSEGTVDFAICSSPDYGRGNVFEPLYSEKAGLLIHQNHRLADAKEIMLRDLQNEHVLITNPLCPFRKQMEVALHEKGGCPYNAIEIGNMVALKYYVQVDFGISIVPVVTATPPPEGTILKEILDLDVGLTIGILKKNDESVLTASAKKLILHIKQQIISQENTNVFVNK